MQADFNTAAVPVMTVTSWGVREWHLNGNLHREDGPAVEGLDGYKAWWVNGKQHREDDPAVEFADGTEIWRLNDKQLEADEIAALQTRIQQKKTTELKNTITEVLTKGFEKDLVAPTTARFKPKVRT